jgi:hypothetical protein
LPVLEQPASLALQQSGREPPCTIATECRRHQLDRTSRTFGSGDKTVQLAGKELRSFSKDASAQMPLSHVERGPRPEKKGKSVRLHQPPDQPFSA